MNLPEAGDYIDIHNHGSEPADGIFSVETLMAHEERMPGNIRGMTFSYGIHPWNLDPENHDRLIERVNRNAANEDIALIGEAGFDRIKGPDTDLQRRTFEEQVLIAEEHKKPMVIHCVRAWEELMAGYKKMKPRMPWLIHGFRGKSDLAAQLVDRGMYISFWFDFVTRPEALPLLRSLPPERIFLETDGSGINIKDIYNKVSGYLGLSTDDLKARIFLNFNEFFNKRY